MMAPTMAPMGVPLLVAPVGPAPSVGTAAAPVASLANPPDDALTDAGTAVPPEYEVVNEPEPDGDVSRLPLVLEAELEPREVAVDVLEPVEEPVPEVELDAVEAAVVELSFAEAAV